MLLPALRARQGCRMFERVPDARVELVQSIEGETFNLPPPTHDLLHDHDRRYTVARSACRRHPAGYARNLGRRLNTLRGLNLALPRLPAPLRRASPVPWSGAPPQAADRGFRAVRPPSPAQLCVRLDAGCRCRWFGTGSLGSGQTRRPPPAGATVPDPATPALARASCAARAPAPRAPALQLDGVSRR